MATVLAVEPEKVSIIRFRIGLQPVQRELFEKFERKR
jgi:hypothetical protein